MKEAWKVTATMRRPAWLKDGEPMMFVRHHLSEAAAKDDKAFVEKYFPGSECTIECVPYDHRDFFSDDDERTQRERDEEIKDQDVYPHRFPAMKAIKRSNEEV